MNNESLISLARSARENAYAPYSSFAVGAALRSTDGRIFGGCNVENISLGLTMCAERAALGTAIAAGCRTFDAIAIIADTDSPISPCGACRQVLAEFSESLLVITVNLNGNQTELSLGDLLPRAKTGILNQP